jgi:hypothetical protein
VNRHDGSHREISFARDLDDDATPVGLGPTPPHHSLSRQTVDGYTVASMADLEPLGQGADRRRDELPAVIGEDYITT